MPRYRVDRRTDLPHRPAVRRRRLPALRCGEYPPATSLLATKARCRLRHGRARCGRCRNGTRARRPIGRQRDQATEQTRNERHCDTPLDVDAAVTAAAHGERDSEARCGRPGDPEVQGNERRPAGVVHRCRGDRSPKSDGEHEPNDPCCGGPNQPPTVRLVFMLRRSSELHSPIAALPTGASGEVLPPFAPYRLQTGERQRGARVPCRSPV